MTLAVQDFLRGFADPEEALVALKDQFAIKIVKHDYLPLTILNYDQIFSRPRHAQIVRECRALVLEIGSWNIVSKSFERFFNSGEVPEITEKFDWGSSFQAYSKEDGSLISVWNYRGELFVSTRGSFAQGNISYHDNLSWDSVVRSVLTDDKLVKLNPDHSYVFELCSPYNKVVKYYSKTQLFLLSVFDRLSGRELWDDLDEISQTIGIERPALYNTKTLEDCLELVKNLPSRSDEGLVLRDKNGLRLKIKSLSYWDLSKLRGEGNDLFRPAHLVPFILRDDREELALYFSECLEFYDRCKVVMDDAFSRLRDLWSRVKSIENQKEFAIAIRDEPFKGILFDIRKTGAKLDEVWAQSAELIVKKLFAAKPQGA